LIHIITESSVIKKGLYPGPGANSSTKDGGGHPKTDFLFMVAETLWGEMSYWPTNKQLTSSVRGKICDKIKS
ncbi:hypothetical protein BDP27DRAFT_1222211, partial [Rhodocollybia butyracea]